MSNQSSEDYSIVFVDNPVEKKQFISQTLIDNTLCIAGSSFKGPAFVPMHITNQTDDSNVSNTINNLIGKNRQHSIGHMFDELNYYINSQSYDALNMWFQNGGQQASFVRTLGNSDTHGGFNSEDIFESFYSKTGIGSRFVAGGSTDLGSTNIITRQYANRQIKINEDIT